MASQPKTFFLVPCWKDEDFSDSIKLGNIIRNVGSPHKSIFIPTEADPVLGLDRPAKTKHVKEIKRVFTNEKTKKFGLFAKILDLLGVGLNLSHSKSNSDSTTYNVDKMTITTFQPTDEFLQSVVKPSVVQTYLVEGDDPRVFLITGTIVAEGITYTTKAAANQIQSGDFGINAHGINVGPSGNRDKKGTDEQGITDPGPTMLAFRVQKIRLGADQKATASDEDGNFYGEDDEEVSESKEPVFDAPLDVRDTAGMAVIETHPETTEGEDVQDEEGCLLVVPVSSV